MSDITYNNWNVKDSSGLVGDPNTFHVEKTIKLEGK